MYQIKQEMRVLKEKASKERLEMKREERMATLQNERDWFRNEALGKAQRKLLFKYFMALMERLSKKISMKLIDNYIKVLQLLGIIVSISTNANFIA